MGWASGSRLMSKVITSVENRGFDYVDKVALFEELIADFEDADCDTLDECLGESSAFDQAFRNSFPDFEIPQFYKDEDED